MTINKTLTTVGVGAAIVAGSMLAVSAVSAHPRGGLSEADQAERITRIAERENITEAEAEVLIEEKRAERQAEREERRAEYLAGLVDEGTLTQEQADELTALKDELKADIQELKDSGAEREEIKAAMEEMRAEVEAWAEAEGLDLEDIKPERGEGKRGHGDRDHDHDDEDGEDDDEVETTSEEI